MLATSAERVEIFSPMRSQKDPNPLPHDYTLTFGEGLANFLSHAVCIVPALIAWYRIQSVCNTFRESAVCFLYGSALFSLFLTSTLYHYAHFMEQTHSCLTLTHKLRPWRRFLSFMDRAVIFIFIAGSYTPWLVLKETGWVGMWVCKATWVAAIFGFIYHQSPLHAMCPRFEAVVYAIVAILPGTVVISTMTNSGLLLLALGGLSYFIGLVFFLKDGEIPYNHAIWHVFVNMGVSFHYTAMYYYLLNENKEMEFSR